LINQADGLLSGVSGPWRAEETQEDPYYDDLPMIPWFRFTDPIHIDERERLTETSRGDLCGCFVPTAKANKDQRDLVDKINRRVLVCPLIKWKEVADRARDNEDRPLGVFVAAAGESKAGVLIDLARQGYLNELIIDQRLAIEIASQLRIDVPATPDEPSPDR